MSRQEFANCGCCKRCTPIGQGLCTRCQPSEPGKADGCVHNGYGKWSRGERCRVRSEPAKRALDRPRDPRCTGRPQGTRKTIQCRWCTKRFPVWEKVPGTGNKETWHGKLRQHAEKEHAWELGRHGITDDVEQMRAAPREKEPPLTRLQRIQQAAKRLKGR